MHANNETGVLQPIEALARLGHADLRLTLGRHTSIDDIERVAQA